MKAIWNDTLLAESDQTVVVEGNHYFPPQSVNQAFFSESTLETLCHWKGKARYYNIEVNGETSLNGAWYYPDTKKEAKHIEGYVAFNKAVNVVE